jgi:hypothetical protein
MTLNIEHLKSGSLNEPMVVFPLKQYENLMDYIEDIEDRLTVIDRMNEEVISKQDFDKRFEAKFGDQ